MRAGGFRVVAKSTSVNGIFFPSKAEARRYSDLCILLHAKEVLWFIRQPSFDLPGGIKYRADFLVVWSDGKIEVEDVKGFRTKEFNLKMRLMKETYPGCPIVLIGKGRKEIA